jgi:hypothetical protein
MVEELDLLNGWINRKRENRRQDLDIRDLMSHPEK